MAAIDRLRNEKFDSTLKGVARTGVVRLAVRLRRSCFVVIPMLSIVRYVAALVLAGAVWMCDGF
jgi:hypothetical protein